MELVFDWLLSLNKKTNKLYLLDIMSIYRGNCSTWVISPIILSPYQAICHTGRIFSDTLSADGNPLD